MLEKRQPRGWIPALLVLVRYDIQILMITHLLISWRVMKSGKWVYSFFCTKNEYWFWLDFYFLFDENLLETFSHNFLQESNQFQQKCFILPALANMVSFVSIFWENVMKYVKKKKGGIFLGYFLVTATSFMKWSIKGFEQSFLEYAKFYDFVALIRFFVTPLDARSKI